MSQEHDTTWLILTGAESHLIRNALANERKLKGENDPSSAERMFNRGITRGTERMAAEFAERQKAKKASGK